VKFTARTFKIQWDVHAWCGVVASTFLFVIFYCGIFALFRDSLAVWQEPASHVAAAPASYEATLRSVEKQVSLPIGAHLDLWWSADHGKVNAFISHPPSKLQRELRLDGVTAQPRGAVYSRLADELYTMHFFYRLPYGTELAGLLAVALFVAIVTGLVIHWKDLVRRWWLFRPQLKLRFSASDAHQVLGVIGLPFATMFAWSGSLLGLWAWLSAPLIYGTFHGDQAAFAVAQGYGPEAGVVALGRPAPRRSLDELVDRARQAVRRSGEAQHLEISAYGDEAAQLAVTFARGNFEPEKPVRLSLSTSKLIGVGKQILPSAAINQVFFDLHYALFGGVLVKALYVLLALGVCAVIMTGNLVWLERRDPQRLRLGNRLLERATVGVSFGLVLSSAVYLAANRALPPVARRPDLEFASFLGAWLVGAALAFHRGASARAWAARSCLASAALFVAVVLGDVGLRSQQLLRPQYAEVEALLVFLLLSSAALGSKLQRGEQPAQGKTTRPGAPWSPSEV